MYLFVSLLPLLHSTPQGLLNTVIFFYSITHSALNWEKALENINIVKYWLNIYFLLFNKMRVILKPLFLDRHTGYWTWKAYGMALSSPERKHQFSKDVQFSDRARSSIQLWQVTVPLTSLTEWACFIQLENWDTVSINKENWEFLPMIMKYVWKKLGLSCLGKWEVIIAMPNCFQGHKMEERLILFCVISGGRTSTAVFN